MVEYFGENPKTTSPSVFFSLFSRFVKAYKVRMGLRMVRHSASPGGQHGWRTWGEEGTGR